MVVMSASEQTKSRGDKSSKNGGKALLVAQEISFAKILAGNDKKLRDRGVKRLRKWLSARSNSECSLEYDDYMRLWKGLYYCMWMADKPLVQEELAETISCLVHSLNLPDHAIKFIETFFRTMSLEWPGIDQHRLEKFLMLVRRFLRQSLVFLDRQNWDLQVTDSLCKTFESTLLPSDANLAKCQAPLGLVMHFTEIFLEELAKVSKGQLNDTVLLRILRIFVQHIAANRDARSRSHIFRHIFIKLIDQSSIGQEFNEKFRAWKEMGFPGGSIDMIEKVDEESDDEPGNESDDEVVKTAVIASNGEGPLDPRAGGIFVELPTIDFDAASVAKLFEEVRFKKCTNAKTRIQIADMINKFEELAKGKCPVGIKSVPVIPDVKLKQLTQKAAEDLLHFQHNLLEKDNDEELDAKESFEDTEGDDTLNENEEIQKKIKSLVKRKNSAPEKIVPKKKKVTENEQSEGKSNKVSLKVAKTRTSKSKIKSKAEPDFVVSDIPAAAGKAQSGLKEVDPILSSDGADAEALNKSIDKASLNEKVGAEALLQHLAPHLVGNKKLKRRASCDAKLQVTAEDNMKQFTESPTTSQGKIMKKRKSMWDEPLQEGEHEIFISKKEILARKKRLSDANVSLSSPKQKLVNPFASPAPGSKINTPGSSSKKVNFVLQRNRAQAESEYFQTLRENPDIPYDANKEPPRGVLKPSPYSSPVNPFYKRKLHV